MTKKKILVAGMDGPTSGSLELMLGSEGYVPMSIQSGDEAFEHICSDPDAFDAIIIEPNMSKQDIDGVEMIKTIREGGIAAPIIALSNRAGIEDKVNGLKAGADAYLTIPFHKDELLAQIEAQFKGFERGKAMGNAPAPKSSLTRDGENAVAGAFRPEMR